MVLFIPTSYFQMFTKPSTFTAFTRVMSHVCFESKNCLKLPILPGMRDKTVEERTHCHLSSGQIKLKYNEGT